MNTITKKARFLLIDDDDTFGTILVAQGKALGVEVEWISSIQKMTSIKKPEQIDFLLVDYDLDDGTGIEVAEFLHKKSAAWPVILISSTDRPQHEKLQFLPNVIGFVSKWGTPSEFFSRVFATAGKHAERRLAA